MLIEVNDTIGRGLIASGIASEVSPPQTEPALSWPRVIEVATPWGIAVRVNAAAPLNARWYPGLASSIVGQGGVLDDPSNGAAIGQPIRSAAGFPLFYALAGGSFVGTPSVLVGDQAFNSDSEALDYIARAAAPNAGATSAPFAWRSEHQAPSLDQWALLGNDEDRALYLDRNTQVARYLINSGKLSHEESSRLANLAIQLRASGRV